MPYREPVRQKLGRTIRLLVDVHIGKSIGPNEEDPLDAEIVAWANAALRSNHRWPMTVVAELAREPDPPTPEFLADLFGLPLAEVIDVFEDSSRTGSDPYRQLAELYFDYTPLEMQTLSSPAHREALRAERQWLLMRLVCRLLGR